LTAVELKSGKKTLTIWWAQWAPADGLQALAEEFGRKENVTVKVHQIPWSSFQDQVFQEFGKPATAFDVVVGDSQWLGRGATKNLYVDLTGWLPTAADVKGLHPLALKYLAEYPELQDELREHRDRIPNFIEEALRMESPVKTDFRLARRATTVGEVRIEAGTPVMLLNGAANRDPRRFECPAEFRADRPNAQEHIAFGRGAHSCPGGPLARAEGRISIERLLARMQDIRLSEEHHGPPGDRRFAYEPTWVLRGLKQLHIEFTPVG